MAIIRKLGLLVVLIAPLGALGQLIDPGTAETSTVPGPNIFQNVLIAMNADVGALTSGDSNPLHLAIQDTFYWDGTSFSDSFNGGSQFVLQNSIPEFFDMGETLDIGYIGNESDDDNELYITAQDSMSNPTRTQTLVNRVNGTPALFDYDADDPNSTDNPPMSYNMIRESGYTGDIYYQVWHDNLSRPGVVAENHTNRTRFRIWEETLNGQNTGNFLLAISDRDRRFENEGDDGFFLIGGDVVPAAPEPPQIAVLAMAGLGGLLYVRRRLRMRKNPRFPASRG